MGTDSSSERNESSSNDRCDHNFNNESLRYDTHANDNMATIHYKTETNSALDRAESFEPSGPDGLSSIANSFVDGSTLRNADTNIGEGCGKCKCSED